VNPDIESLLALQTEDAAIRRIEKKAKSIEPRLLDLDRQRQVAADALARARHQLESEERKHRELQLRVTEHRTQQERNVAQLDQVRKMREATAAMSQVEQARRVLADEENVLSAMHRRVGDLRQAVEIQEQALHQLEEEQAGARAQIAEERAAMESELADARKVRDGRAAKVPRPLLAKYDRIATRRRDDVLFALRGPSCGNCDTAIPLHRRSTMASTGQIEMCEECGVLLYATE
jgi:predicted  nucleic acid-binding Zn-ribbon protein